MTDYDEDEIHDRINQIEAILEVIEEDAQYCQFDLTRPALRIEHDVLCLVVGDDDKAYSNRSTFPAFKRYNIEVEAPTIRPPTVQEPPTWQAELEGETVGTVVAGSEHSARKLFLDDERVPHGEYAWLTANGEAVVSDPSLFQAVELTDKMVEVVDE